MEHLWWAAVGRLLDHSAITRDNFWGYVLAADVAEDGGLCERRHQENMRQENWTSYRHTSRTHKQDTQAGTKENRKHNTEHIRVFPN